MLDLLQQDGWNPECVSQDGLSTMKLTFPCLVIANATHDGTHIVDTIAHMLESNDQLGVIFVLPKMPQSPVWGDPFLGKKAAFFTFGYADKEFLSIVHRCADYFGWKRGERTGRLSDR